MAWEKAERKQEALLVGYFVAGDPGVERSLSIVKGATLAGVDILEIGVPSAEPSFDGEVIKRGHRRVLTRIGREVGERPADEGNATGSEVQAAAAAGKADGALPSAVRSDGAVTPEAVCTAGTAASDMGAGLVKADALKLAMDARVQHETMAYWRKLRHTTDAPLWAMGYKREVIASGLYVELAREGLLDGLVLPDCSLAEQLEITRDMEPYGVDVIRFVHAAMNEAELQAALEGATIVYAQLYTGATGNPFAQFKDLGELCRRVKRYTDAMVLAGFGLRSPERVRAAVESGFDAAVVGSVFVARCENGEVDYLYRLIADMKEATSRRGKEGNEG